MAFPAWRDLSGRWRSCADASRRAADAAGQQTGARRPIPPTLSRLRFAQVAEWAGHSIAVLLRVYAKYVAGQEEDTMRRISEATRPKCH
jgi:hypothetical protein